MTSPPAGAGAVLVVRWGAAGDLLQASGAMAALKHAWPEAPQVLVTHASVAALGAGLAAVDAVEPLAPGGGLGELWARLATYRPAAWLDLHGKPRGRWLAWRHPLGALGRLPGRPLALRLAVRFGGARARPHRPLAERCHDAVERLVGRQLARRPLAWRPPEATEAAVRALLAARAGPAAAQGAYVVLAPGAAWGSKRWPVAHFRALARQVATWGLASWVIGGPDDAARCAAVADGIGGARPLPDLGDWAHAGALVGGARAVVANDSGAMHLARLQGVPTVALFGPTDPDQFDLRGHHPLSRRLDCAPCHFYGQPACPRGHHRCLAGIAPAHVAAALAAALAGPRAPLPMC